MEPLWMNLYLIILCAPENHTHCMFIEFEIPVTSHYQSKSCLRIYIYRYMTYMGFQICVSTHGDLRLKMSKQVRSIWKISIHLNSLFIFPSPHENNDYSITFLDQSAPNPPGVPRLTLGVGANVAEGHPFNSLHGEHSRLGQWGSSQRWCLNEKDVFPCLKLNNPI